MSFLNPTFFWALPLIAIPVILHLFKKKHTRVIQWGAMDFLLATKTPQRRMMKWRELLLMLLRVAVIVLVLTALAQPMWSTKLMGSRMPRDVIFVLDNSLSTSRSAAGGKAFDAVALKTAEAIEELHSGDRVRVLVTSPSPAWLFPDEVSGGASDQNKLKNQIAEITPSGGTADLPQCIAQAVQAKGLRKGAPRRILVITDGQANAWRTNSLHRWGATKTIIDRSPAPVIIDVIEAAHENAVGANLAVTQLKAQRETIAAGQPVTVRAVIKNGGDRSSQATLVSWSADGESLGISSLPALEPGEGSTVTFDAHFPTAGVHEIKCEVDAGDNLSADNFAKVFIEVKEQVRLLFVTAEPNSKRASGDNEFFTEALGEEGSPGQVFTAKTIAYDSFDSEKLGGYACVVLANVPTPNEQQRERLKHYVKNGGGLWMALGDRTFAEAFNDGFFEEGLGLVPFPVKEPIGDASNHEISVRLAAPAVDHPATALLADSATSDFDRTRVYRRFDWSREKSNDAVVLLRLDGGAPVAVEKTFGRGRTIVQAFPLGIEWSNLPLNQAFVVMVHEWLWYLAEPSFRRRNLKAGEVLETRDSVARGGKASLHLPDGKSVTLLAKQEGDEFVFRHVGTVEPGEYRLVAQSSLATQTSEKFIISRDELESDLALTTGAQIAAISNATGINFGSRADFSSRADQKIESPPQILSEPALYAVLIVLAAEGFLAFWITHQRRPSAPGVRMTA